MEEYMTRSTNILLFKLGVGLPYFPIYINLLYAKKHALLKKSKPD